jgi:arylsulfatase A-like enzyme
VPCIARWPGRLPGGRVSDELAVTMDLFELDLDGGLQRDVAAKHLDVVARLKSRFDQFVAEARAQGISR